MTENKMTGLLLQLADLGVTGIKINYSGGGDSGAIGGMIYTREEVLLDDLDDLEPYSQNVLNLEDLDSSIYSDLEEFAQSKLLDDIEDWWNNDGGYGTLLISIPSGNYKINNSIYTTETEEFIHGGNLINRSFY